MPASLDALAERDELRGVDVVVVRTEIDLDAAPADTADAYLRLHLLSHRLVVPHGLNLDGLFGVLANVVWTNHGPCDVDGFEETRLRLRATGQPVTVLGVDKFPAWWTTSSRRASGSPTRTACASGRTSRPAPR